MSMKKLKMKKKKQGNKCPFPQKLEAWKQRARKFVSFNYTVDFVPNEFPSQSILNKTTGCYIKAMVAYYGVCVCVCVCVQVTEKETDTETVADS